jgi:hypothetical protein
VDDGDGSGSEKERKKKGSKGGEFCKYSTILSLKEVS